MQSRSSVLQQEIKQTRPFRSREQEALLNLFRTADELRRGIGQVVSAAGLTLQHYNVLRILRGAGPDGLPTLEIAQRMVERSPGITRLIDRLEAMSLVIRSRPSEDRRCVYCIITEPGLAVLERLDDPMDQWIRTHLGRLGDTRLEDLILLLEEVRLASTEAISDSPEASAH